MPNFFINVKEKGAKKAAGNIKSLTGSMKMMALQAVSVVTVMQGLRKSIQMSAEMEGVRRGFDNLAKSSGFSTQAFQKFQAATDGTVGSMELMKQANNAMLLGITDSEEQMANMLDVAQRLGQSLGLDTVQAVESLVTGLGRQCLTSDSFISTTDGLKQIIDIKEGDIVLSINNGEIIETEVTHLHKNGIQPVYIVTFKDGKYIKSTDNHRYLTDGGWKYLSELNSGSMVLNTENEYSEIYSIDSFGEEEVYDLTVPETANFFANGLCVHNSKLMLDNLGIMVDTNKSYKDYAVSIGKTTSQLTDQERKTAFVNAAMEEANSLVAQLGEEQLTTKDSINQVVTAAGDLAIKFGDVLGPAVRDVAGFLTDLLENTQAFLEWADGVNTAEEAQKQLDEEFIKTKSLISDVSEQFGLTTDSSKTLIGQMRDLKDELAIMSEDDFLQGRINPAINAQFRLGEQMRLTSTAMKDQIENTIQLTPVYTEVTDIASEYLNTLEKIPIVSEDVSKAQQDAIDDALKLEKQRKQEARNFVSNMQTMGKAYPEMEKAGKRAAQVQALVDAYAGANAAYKAMAGIAFVGPALGIAAAAAALGAGLANVKMIEKAATGADFVTSGPQMLMVGDNPGGREQVSVTPLSSPNIEGPQGGNPITLNISAPLLDDTVVDSIIPALREAIRRGESIGIV